MKKKSLVALVATLLIVAGVGTAYASKSSSGERKTEATGEFTQEHLDEMKDRQEARKDRNDSREEKNETQNNFDNEKKGELSRVTHYITNLERSVERATRLASVRAISHYVRPERALDASGETSTTLLLKLKDVQTQIEGAENAEDLEKSVEALTDLIAPAKK